MLIKGKNLIQRYFGAIVYHHDEFLLFSEWISLTISFWIICFNIGPGYVIIDTHGTVDLGGPKYSSMCSL